MSIVLLNSCGDRKLISEESHKIDGEWRYDNGISFTINSPDTTDFYDLDLEIIHTDEYGFQNLYIKTETTYPNEEAIESQVNMDLAVSSGEWLGSCRGKDCITPIAFAPRFKFNQIGPHKITIHQNTRDSLLAEIKALTLKVYRLK